jgi:hypothetical protein
MPRTPRDPDDIWLDIFGTTGVPGICTPSRHGNITERRERTEGHPIRVDHDRENVFTRREQERKERVEK